MRRLVAGCLNPVSDVPDRTSTRTIPTGGVTWPPMVGVTPETLSIAHYEPDAGLFIWRQQRSTLGL